MKYKRIIILFSLTIFLITGICLIPETNQNYYLSYNTVNEITDTVINEDINYNQILNNIKNEYNNNDDIKGILSIPNTNYISPIPQGKDNQYYLDHTPDKKSNYMGSTYLDYRLDINSSKKLLIFGHNSANIDMPFKILENYYDSNYYNNHQYIEITTNETLKKYEIFSVYIATKDFTYMNINFKNSSEWYNHLLKLKNASMYNTNVDVSPEDEILILQTCSTHQDYQKYDKKYLLVIAKRIK